MESNTVALIGLGLTALVVVLGLALFMRRRRSILLQQRFGPEYERVVDLRGPDLAESELRERQNRVAGFSLHSLGLGERQRFRTAWRRSQEEFVDNPERALTHADELLGDVMAARGYPSADFDQRAADLSVDHAAMVRHYRAAHDIAARHETGEATTEDLRQAMIHYRTLLDELVSEPEAYQARAS